MEMKFIMMEQIINETDIYIIIWINFMKIARIYKIIKNGIFHKAQPVSSDLFFSFKDYVMKKKKSK